MLTFECQKSLLTWNATCHTHLKSKTHNIALSDVNMKIVHQQYSILCFVDPLLALHINSTAHIVAAFYDNLLDVLIVLRSSPVAYYNYPQAAAGQCCRLHEKRGVFYDT
jgi:hypothetical protein